MNMLKKIKKWFERIKSSDIRYKYSFLKVLNSPFRGLRLTWYFGKIAIGTPYFLPRKWVKMDKKHAIESANEDMNRKYPDTRPFDKIVESKMQCRRAVPIKYFGFQFTTLGWKTKWEDYRFEWNPSISIVLFGKQLFIGIIPNIDKDCMHDVYWEAWLNYAYETDKTNTELERLKELISKHSCTWIHFKDKEQIKTNHYTHILKKKYLKLVDIEDTIEHTDE